MNKTEEEIVAKTGVEKFEDESREDYLKRLVEGINALTDEEFDALSNKAQDWNNMAALAYKNDKKIRDFDMNEITDSVTDVDNVTECTPQPQIQEEVSPPSTVQKKKVRTSSGNGKDKFGLRVGSKTSEAVKLYETGVKMADIREKLGGNYYVILKKLQQEGHKVEHLPGGVIKLTHKDEL